MDKHSISISFGGVSPDAANSLAESLASDVRREVKEDGRSVSAEIKRTDPSAMDFGTTLAVVLGTPAVIILARAIRDWAKRTGNKSQISINGNVIQNVASEDVADIVKAMNSPKK
jgi:hypothetical protein